MKTGVELIAEERERQVVAEGWTPEHDDSHTDESLATVAALYALPRRFRETRDGSVLVNVLALLWPKRWHQSWWKPARRRIHDLVRAGALIAAEIDRLQRAQEEGDG